MLTAIAVDRKDIETATFKANEAAHAQAWVAERNDKKNLYFMVNAPTGILKSKAKREDVEAVTWLHVDIDPRAGEDLKAEQARALKLLKNPPSGVPKPTVVVFSGGGYQGFWKLEEPIHIGGQLEAAENAKLYNVQLELVFGADQCHNVDRIMRLPGTINIPDEKKRRKGRTVKLARVVSWHDERLYPLSQFTPAQAVQTAEPGFRGNLVQAGGDAKRLGSVEDLGDSVPDWCKALIVQGDDPNDPTKYTSRSEALFAACCELVRHGLDNETIYSVITDPDFGISGSVLDKKSGAERYAVRQIERAREEAIDPWLRKLNERHAVIASIGGRCRVVEETHDASLDRSCLQRQSFDDFRNRYMHKKVQCGEDKDGNPKMMPMGKWWLEQEHRRQYDAIVFSPNKEVNGAYNLWRGFACESIPGDPQPFLEHTRLNICAGDDEVFRYVVAWMARCVQKPDTPGEVAIVLRGRQGTGKSFFAKSFGSLWGRHFMQVSDPKHLVGSFNSHLRDCVVLLGDEAFYAGDPRHVSVLKTLITEETITIEAKGVDVEVSKNFMHLILASNSTWVVPTGLDERRFLVMDVGDDKMQNAAYFGELQKQLDSGGREALLHYLLSYDITGYDPRVVPKTSALLEQKLLSLTTEQEWWFRKLEEGRILKDHGEWIVEVEKDHLIDNYLNYAQRIGAARRATATALGRFLNQACPGVYPRNKLKKVTVIVEGLDGEPRQADKRRYHWIFPPLDKCRVWWDQHFGGPYDWPEIEEVEEKQREVPF